MGIVSPYTLFYTDRGSGSGKTRRAKKKRQVGGGGVQVITISVTRLVTYVRSMLGERRERIFPR